MESRSPKVQFRLATLLLFMAVVGLLALLGRLMERSPRLQQQLSDPGVFYAALVSWCALSIALSGYWSDGSRRERLGTALAILAGLWILQVMSALGSWYVWGEAVAAVHWWLIGSILVPACLCGAQRYSAAIWASVIVGVFLLPLWVPPVVMLVWPA